jgi:two-component system chemotaxis response regulator CheY
MSEILSQIKVLIVDDHPMTLILLGKVLKQLGLKNIKEAEDGKRALAMICLDDFNLVFTDLDMPALSGLELIQELRQKEATRDLPVIVVSGESDQDKVFQALQAGADAFVVKPFSSRTIKEKIVQVFSKRVRPAS